MDTKIPIRRLSEQPLQERTGAQGGGRVLEVERTGYFGTELKVELAGLPEGKKCG